MYRMQLIACVLVVMMAWPRAALAEVITEGGRGAAETTQQVAPEARAAVVQALIAEGMSPAEASLVVDHLEPEDIATFAENPEMVQSGGFLFLFLLLLLLIVAIDKSAQ